MRRQHRGKREKALTTLIKGTQPFHYCYAYLLSAYILYLASKRRSLQMDSGQQGRQYKVWPGVCAVHLTLTARVGPVYHFLLCTY